MEPYHLFDAEARFMDIVWREEPLSSRRLTQLCEKELGWKRTTTYTVLKKLSDRGIVKNEDRQVVSLVKRETILKEESRQVLKRSFQDSLPLFLTSFLGGRRLSGREADELKRLIDAYREENEPEEPQEKGERHD